MSEQGGTFMQMIGGVASEKCSSSQLVDLMMNEVWFGVHRLKSCVSKPNPRQEATFLSGLGWKYPFHLRPAACGEKFIFTTTSLGRTKILQFLPLRPPLGRTTKTCFCVGSDGYIRVECGSTHPSTHGYMILATTNPHSSPIQPNPHKSLQYPAKHKVYIESDASFEYILWQNPISFKWWMHL